MNKEIKRFDRSYGHPHRLVDRVMEEIRRRVDRAYDQPDVETGTDVTAQDQAVTAADVIVYEDGEKESSEARAREARMQIDKIHDELPAVTMPD